MSERSDEPYEVASNRPPEVKKDLLVQAASLCVARAVLPPQGDNAFFGQPEIKSLMREKYTVDKLQVFILPPGIGDTVLGIQPDIPKAGARVMRRAIADNPRQFPAAMKPTGLADSTPQAFEVVDEYDMETKVYSVGVRPDGITQGKIYREGEALLHAAGLTQSEDYYNESEKRVIGPLYVPPEDPFIVLYQGRGKRRAQEIIRIISRTIEGAHDNPLTFALGDARVHYSPPTPALAL